MDSPYLDKSKIIAIHDGSNLPHWNQPEKIQFVSFRLNDSLPQNKIIELRNLIYEFKKDHPEPWDVETKKLYRNIIGKEDERLLDAGYGRRGSLWRREYFDRIVRDEDELKSYLSYIQLNPVNLQQNKYEVYP